MELNEYQALAERTSNPTLSTWQKMENGCYGMCGEAGECMDILKKVNFQGHTFDPNRLIDELGDVLWYVAQTATGLGISLNEVAQSNIDKLRKRYPKEFTPEQSIRRPND